MGRIAWKRRSRPDLGRTAGRIPFDDINLAKFWIFLLAIGQLARQACRCPAPICAASARALFGQLRALGRLGSLFQQSFWQWQDFHLRNMVNSSPDNLLDNRSDIAVAKTLLCLAFKLRIGHFDRNHSCQPFAHIFAGDGDLVDL